MRVTLHKLVLNVEIDISLVIETINVQTVDLNITEMELELLIFSRSILTVPLRVNPLG